MTTDADRVKPLEACSLVDCPVGLFLAGGTLCFKSEYGNNEGRIDAYIISSGEFFWGAAPQTIESQRSQIVRPIDEAHILAALAPAPVNKPSSLAEDLHAILRGITEPAAAIASKLAAQKDAAAALAPAPQAADALDIAMHIGSEVRRRNRVGADGERSSISSCCEGAAVDLVLNSLRACGFAIHRAAAPQEAPADDETYELGKSDGYSQAVQEIDRLTGGDGEYRYCTDKNPERHTPDPTAMVQRIVARFAAAQEGNGNV